MEDGLKSAIKATVDSLKEPNFDELSEGINQQTGKSDSFKQTEIRELVIRLIEGKKEWNNDQKNNLIEKINDNNKENPFKKHVASWESFVQSVENLSSEDGYFSKIFIDGSGKRRHFPTGTLSYIGARPGRGKTTVLVSCAADAINAGKNVVFITAEENPRQIIVRFIANYLYGFSTSDDSMKPCIESLQKEQKIRDEIYGFVRGDKCEYGEVLKKPVNEVKKLMSEERLVIFNMCGNSFETLISYLRTLTHGTIVLIDYIQRLKVPEKLLTQTRQVQIQRMSNALADIAGEKEIILIVGAQLNRNATKVNNADILDESSFREAGDIEQDGHILIQMGQREDGEGRFYRCLKDREGEPDKTEKNFETALAFSYLAREEQSAKSEREQNTVSFSKLMNSRS